MVVNSSLRTQQREDRYQTGSIASVKAVHIRLLVSVMLSGSDEVVLETSGTEGEVLVEEGITPSSRGFGTGLYPIADQRAESLSSTRVVGCSSMLEDEPEEDFHHAPTGKPVAVSVVTSEVSVHPRSLLERAVSSDRVSEPRGLPLPSHAPSSLDPQETSEEGSIGSTQVEVQAG